MKQRTTKENEYGEAEVAQRRDEALRRALSTPPNPKKPVGKKKAARKDAAKGARGE